MDWTDINIRNLLITLSGNDHYELNYNNRILNLRNVLHGNVAKVSLKGKITVVNNVALPPILHVANVIHTLDIVPKKSQLLHKTL